MKDERLANLSRDEAGRLITLFDQAEKEIQKEINRALLNGNQTRYLLNMKRNIDSMLTDLRNGYTQWIQEAIPTVYQAATDKADTMVEKTGIAATFGAVHLQAAQSLADSAYTRFEDVITKVGRRVDDIYRKVALESTRGSVIGYQTWKQVANKYKKELVDNGITGFTDKAGRKWDMTNYAKMVARTTTMEAHLEGTKNRLLELGQDLVMVSYHPNACKLCEPWQGKILSLTGKTEGYDTLDEAKEAGLFHPNCEHGYGLYVAALAA